MRHQIDLIPVDTIEHEMDENLDDVKLPCSRTQMDKLGARLCVELVAQADMDLLSEILVGYDECLARAEVRIRRVVDHFTQDESAVALTTRVKTTGTIREKLQREHGMGLKAMQDIAGVRLSGPFTRWGQDRLRDQLVREFADGRKPPREFDRRADPSFGYRAVHLVIHVGSLPVEVQIRTQAQDSWAQVIESLGDTWGRGIRYGQAPEQPDTVVYPGTTRMSLLNLMLEVSDTIAGIEVAEASIEQQQKELFDLQREVESLPADHDLRGNDMLGRLHELEDLNRVQRAEQRLTINGLLRTLDTISEMAERWSET